MSITTTIPAVAKGETLTIDTAEGTIEIARSDDGALGRVVRICGDQVQDAIRADAPAGGGCWYGADTTSGREYVAGWHSWATVRRQIREALAQY